MRGFAKEVRIIPRHTNFFLKEGLDTSKRGISGLHTKIVPCANIKFLKFTEDQIFAKYQNLLEDLLNYYSFLDNAGFLPRILYILKYSLLYTLSRKYRLTISRTKKKYARNLILLFKDKAET